MEHQLKELRDEKVKGSRENLKVLILEDSLSDAELIKLQFEELDLIPEYRVTETKEEYLRLLEKFRPDLVVSDFNLPRFDGLKALNILRKNLNDEITPFLFVTGTLGEENAVRAIKGGATDFIIKERVHQLPAAVIRALREKREKISRKEASDREIIKDRRFKKLVQEGADLITIIDYEGKIQFSSDNYEKILGYSTHTLKGADLFELINQEDLNKVRTSFYRIKQESNIKVEPYRIRDAHNNWRWLQSTATNLYSDEAISGIVVNSSEVTELIEKERELLLSNEKYYLASLATQDLIYDWDLKGGSINRDGQALYRMYGYDPEKAKDEQFWNGQIHPEDTARVFDDLRVSLQDPDQTLYQQNYRFRRNDGSYAYVHDKGYILRDSEGIAVRLIGATRDISEQKEKERIKDLILTLSNHLSKPKGLSECMNEVLETLIKHLGMAYAELWLSDKHNNHLNLISQYAEDSSGEVMYEKSGQMSKDEGLPGKVFNEGKAVIWADIKNKSKFSRKKSAEKAQLESAIGIPISQANQTLGAFVFFSKEKQFNFKRNLNILQEVCRWISLELQRKQATEELDRFFTVSADLLGILGTDGFFKKINPAFTDMLGYSEMEFLGNPFKHFVHPEDDQMTKSHLKYLQQGEKSVHFENRIISKEGRVKWFSWSAIIQPKEEVVFVIGRDITEKKRLEELVQQTQSMAKIGSWELDLIKETLHWTSQTKEIHEVDQNYQPSLDTAMNFYKDGECKEIIEKCVKDGMELGRPWDQELQIITAKGNVKWVRTMGKAEMSEGKCIRLYGIFQDIEAHKKNEEALKISNRRFELSSKATLEAIYEWDCQNNELYWTDNYSILFGYEELTEKFDDWKSRIHTLDRKRILSSLKKLLASPDQHYWKNEYRFIKRDKRIAFVEERGYVIRDKEGKAITMIGSISDITEKKLFQEQLLENTIQSEEKERNRIAQELHDGIVQEMVVCSMRCDLLHKSNKGNPELDEKISEVTAYIKQITNNTRDISHNLLAANVKEMTFLELLERLDLNLRIMSGIKFNIELFLGSEIKLDEVIKINLYRVIQELTNNIIKHSGATRALILVERINNSISIKISDNGKGINAKHTSNGIGLSNVNNRIDTIGGKIDFRNGEHGGLEVIVSVPIG